MLARPGLPNFEYVRPSTLEAAVRLLRERRRARPVMGGTDLFPKMRDGVIRPDVLVDVKALPGMRAIVVSEEGLGGITVGAAVTMNELAHHRHVQVHYPLLAEAASSVGSYQVRNRATIGGNLCNASPCADAALAALVLDGRVVLRGPDRAPDSTGTVQREMPITSFLIGPGQTALRPGEFLTAIRLPPPPPGAVGRHLKLSRNRLGDLSLVSVDVLGFPAHPEPDQGASDGPVYRFRLGLGSVAPTLVRATEAEVLAATHPPGEETFAVAADRAAAYAAPIDDVRAGAAYRRAMVRNLTLRGLREVCLQLRDALGANGRA